MTKSLSIFQYFKQRIPPKYRLIAFLVITSIIGVLLIFLAVYNTSKDIELIHEVDNLHRFAKARLVDNNRSDDLARTLTNQTSGDYQVWILEKSNVTHLLDDKSPARFPLDMSN